MCRKFNIKTVLTAISGINIADDFNDVFELYWYVFDDNTITTTGLEILRPTLFEHLHKQYKELNHARYYVYTQYSVLLQKYGEELEILPMNLKENITYVDSNEKKEFINRSI